MSQTPFEAPSIESIAALLPAFEFDCLIAQGGMGAVYRARQISLDRDVAIKILPKELCQDPSFCESFRAEAKAMARLIHPNLIGVFDSGEVDGLLYIVMEMVPGKSLYHSAYRQAIDPAQAVEIVLGALRGLAHAHENGIIHRDIKPANILLTPKREPKIGDFGLARTTASGNQGPTMGTPGYTAPEVIEEPERAYKRSDIFSIGVVLRELLTGAPPATDAPETPIQDPVLLQICNKATHRNPDMRFPDAQAMVKALERWLTASTAPAVAQSPPAAAFKSPSPSPAKSLMPKLVVASLILIGAAGVAWMIVQSDQSDPEATAHQTTDSEITGDGGPMVEEGIVETSALTSDDRSGLPEEEETRAPSPRERLNPLRNALVSGARDEMPVGTIRRGDHLFFFVTTPMKWVEAQRFAARYDAHLPIVRDRTELDWLKSQLGAESDPDETGSSTWIGARAFGKRWFAVDGSPWQDFEAEGNGAFAVIGSDGRLTATKDNERHPFFLQWHQDGSNPSRLESMLARTASTLNDAQPAFPFGIADCHGKPSLIVWRSLDAAGARELATLGGGRLIEVRGPEDADWLDLRLGKRPLKNGFWLGGQRIEGKWSWTSGREWTVDRWAEGEPKDDGVHLCYLPGKGWASAPMEKRQAGFVIEWDPPSPPAPESEIIGTPETELATPAPLDEAELAELKNDPLRLKAEALLKAEDEKRTLALKANSKDFNFKLGTWLKRNDAGTNLSGRRRTVEILQVDGDRHRIPKDIPPTANPVFPESVLEITRLHLARQEEIDQAFEEKAETIRKFYLKKLEEAKLEAESNTGSDAVRKYGRLLEGAGELKTWLASFEGLEPEAAAIVSFEIVSAIWGIGEVNEDVTERFRELFYNKGEPFRIDYIRLRSDPVPGPGKTLILSYKAYGIEDSRTLKATSKFDPSAFLISIGLDPAIILGAR